MDETILNINVKKWTESIQFLKSQEIKQQLDPAEWTAVDELSNLWNKDFDRDDVKATAAELVADLKRCENQHPNNLDIKKYSKQLTAVVREMLMKDRPTYEAFKLKLQTIYRRRRPTPPPPKPQPTPPPTPQPDPTIVKRQADNFIEAFIFLNDFDIVMQLSNEEAEAITNLYVILRDNPVLTSQVKDEANKSIADLKRYENLHPANLQIKTKSKAVTAAMRSAIANAPTYQLFRESVRQPLVHFIQEWAKEYERRQNNPIEITQVELADCINGKRNRNFGEQLYAGLYFLTPRITINTILNQTVEFGVEIFNQSGVVQAQYKSQVNVNGNGTYILDGYGNDKGTFLSTPGTYTCHITYNDKVLNKTCFTLEKLDTSDWEEMVREIIEDSTPKDSTPTPPPPPRRKSHFWQRTKWFLIIAFFLLIAWRVGPTLWDLIFPDTKCYSIAESTILRSEPSAEANAVETFPYGYLYERKGRERGGWQKVEIVKTGYIASRLLINKEDYKLFNSIFGGNDDVACSARRAIMSVGARIALLNYYKNNHMRGFNLASGKTINDMMRVIQGKNVWLFIEIEQGSYYPNFYLDEDQGIFAAILFNPEFDKRKVIVFTRSADSSDYALRYEHEAPAKVGIKSVTSSSSVVDVEYGDKKTSTTKTTKKKKKRRRR